MMYEKIKVRDPDATIRDLKARAAKMGITLRVKDHRKGWRRVASQVRSGIRKLLGYTRQVTVLDLTTDPPTGRVEVE
jgi:hypothetical protein